MRTAVSLIVLAGALSAAAILHRKLGRHTVLIALARNNNVLYRISTARVSIKVN